MVRVYRQIYTDRHGQHRKVKRWWISFRDHKKIKRYLPGFTNKATTEAFGKQLDKLVAVKDSGGSLDAELTRWLKEIPQEIKKKLLNIGLVEQKEVAAGQPLKEHIKDFINSLRVKERAEKHIKQIKATLESVFDACDFVYWSDLSANRLESYLADLRDRGRGISSRTFNFKLKVCQQFARWMVKNYRAVESPIAHLSTLSLNLDKRRRRRALSIDDVRRLLAKTQSGPERFGLSGATRSLIYKMAIQTGLRSAELRNLTVGDFNFEGNPTITVQACYSKHRRQDVIPLRPDTAAELKAYLLNKTPDCKAFNLPDRPSEMIRADLETAGIPYVLDGKVFDFHSLRGECASLLAYAKVHPKVAQSILRHSDINLTMNAYTHTLIGQEAKAVADLPDLSVSKDDKAKETA